MSQIEPKHDADELLARAAGAADVFRAFDQAQVDGVVHAVFEAAYEARAHLARLAIDETGIGVYEHKVLKNAWASLLVYQDIRHRRTVGEIRHDPGAGLTEVAQPRGPVLGTVPLTNPTSTAIFKALICLKTRNPLIISPHRAARRCVRETARILLSAAEAAGAPPHVIQVMTRGGTDHLEAVMRHPSLALILATGTTGIVELAQRSGTPSYGVGPGNVPVYVHHSADLPHAASSIVHSKTFDNGTVCASEQALVVEHGVAARLRALMEERGAYFCSPAETQRLGPVCFDIEHARMRPEAVGQPAAVLAARAGFDVPAGTRLVVAECSGVGPAHPLSHEILMPVLALYTCESYAESLEVCRAVTRRGGIGHTVAVYADDETVVGDFAQFEVSRILVNQPTTQGAIGGIFNCLRPSLTLACGTGAGNVTTDNITTDHLLNIHRVARLRPNARWLDVREATLDGSLGAGDALKRYTRT